ncbi:metal-dependent hydrolase family protein [Acuticoccus yangtzensis]|uniref:metal-dependent hydrolase family protein n=1 Tax=Acuticoccus yangtzensis TaxID=1443441 RepID=UPI0009F888E5|nr:amidohydrolase family protein [Acuticoccus yangtzensis]
MSTTIFKNAAVLDTETCRLTRGQTVVVRGGRIARIGSDGPDDDGPGGAPSDGDGEAAVIDCGGRTLMPGLIDAHVHINTTEYTTLENVVLPNSLVAARAVGTMNAMLMRGFTTVRDMGGADTGYIRAVDEGTIVGPDLMICGKMLCQTGGHQDVRLKWDWQDPAFLRGRLGAKARLCDGVPEVRHAAREELRAGAQFIKIIANGGLAAHGTPLSHLAFSEEEIAAIVEEAGDADTYVAAHAYTDKAVERCVRLGVKSIEHCFFVSPRTADMMAEKGVTAVPTLAVVELRRNRPGATPEEADKAARLLDEIDRGLAVLKAAGVAMAYGTDLTHASVHAHQSREFLYRLRGESSADVLRSATIVGAKLVKRAHEIGNVFEGARANLLVVDGNPAEDVALLADPGRIGVIVKAGAVVKNMLPVG